MEQSRPFFSQLKLPEGAVLRRKQQFEYTTVDNFYDIELFENTDGTFYAIGLPRNGRVVVYGSNVVATVEMALQTVIHKIDLEHNASPTPFSD